MHIDYVNRKICKCENKGSQILIIKCAFIYLAGQNKICKRMMTVITTQIRVENMKIYPQIGHAKIMLFPSPRYGGWKSEIEVSGGTLL